MQHSPGRLLALLQNFIQVLELTGGPGQEDGLIGHLFGSEFHLGFSQLAPVFPVHGEPPEQFLGLGHRVSRHHGNHQVVPFQFVLQVVLGAEIGHVPRLDHRVDFRGVGLQTDAALPGLRQIAAGEGQGDV